MRIIFLFLFLFTKCIVIFSQVDIGIKNNQYFTITYHFTDAFSLRAEHSIYSEKLKYQYLRLYFNYKIKYKNLTTSFSPYLGTTYGGHYLTLGGTLNSKWDMLDRLSIEGTINPHYDNSLGMFYCYKVGLESKLSNILSPTIYYDNIPVYRISEEYLKLGIKFIAANLLIHPELAIPILSNNTKCLRLLISFNCKF